MVAQAEQISDREDLGRAKRGEGIFFGVLATLPFLVLAVAAWLLPVDWVPWLDRSAVMYGAALLVYWAGVRRGLTFSEIGGGSQREILTTLAMFVAALAAIWLRSGIAATAVAMLGLMVQGILDMRAGRRLEAPGYFVVLRPMQTILAAFSLLALLVAEIGIQF